MNDRRQTVLCGVSALTKSLTLIFGVPVVIDRLWSTLPYATNAARWQMLAQPATWGAIVIVVVAELWFVASLRLVRDLGHAICHQDRSHAANWSAQWASAIAGLVLFVGASSLINSGVASAATANRHLSTPVPASLVSPDRLSSTSVVQDSRQANRSTTGPFGFDPITCAGLLRQFECALRRRARDHRKATAISAVRSSSVDLAQSLASASKRTGIDLLDTTVRYLFSESARPEVGQNPPSVQLISVGANQIRLRPNTVDQRVPPPFEKSTDGATWIAPIIPSNFTGQPFVENTLTKSTPVVFPLGQDKEMTYLIAVAPWRSLGIVGADDDVDATLTAIVFSLCAMPWAEQIDIELIGTGHLVGLKSGQRLRHSSPTVLQELGDLGACEDNEELIDSRETPRVLIVGRQAAISLHRDALKRLERSTALVVAGSPGTTTLSVGAKRSRLLPFDIALSTPRVSIKDCSSLVDLLALNVAPNQSTPLCRKSKTEFSDSSLDNKKIALMRQQPTFTVSSTLGFATDNPTEVSIAAYLALHGRSSLAELRRAIACGHHRTTADVERAIERSQRRRLTHVDVDDQITLTSAISTDWDHLATTLRDVAEQTPQRKLHALIGALQMIHAPFSSQLVEFRWMITEGFIAAMNADIVDATHQVAALATATGDAPTAIWAIRKGQAIEPASEILSRDLFRTGQLQQNCLGMSAEYRRLENELFALNELEPTFETDAVYDHAIDSILQSDKLRNSPVPTDNSSQHSIA